MTLKSFIIFLLSAFVIVGCTTGKIAMQEDNIDQKVAGSPFIKRYPNNNYSVRTPSESIEVYYKTWNALNRPEAIRDWKMHFQIAEGSDPKKRYIEIGEITYYQKDLDDKKAIDFLKNAASQEGGDAIADAWRRPVIDQVLSPSRIVGYRFNALIIRYTEL
ncbi:hypothetical protein ACWWD9_04595 [Methylovorus sp. SPW-M1]